VGGQSITDENRQRWALEGGNRQGVRQEADTEPSRCQAETAAKGIPLDDGLVKFRWCQRSG
jgi:hypothetical protein